MISLGVIKQAFASSHNRNLAVLVALLVFTAGQIVRYVDMKHDAGLEAVAAAKVDMEQLVIAQERIQEMRHQVVLDALNEIKDSAKRTEDRVWELYREAGISGAKKDRIQKRPGSSYAKGY